MLLSTLHSIASGLIRRSWLVAVITLAVCGGLAAQAWAAFQTPDEPTPPAPTTVRRVPTKPLPARRVTDGTALVARNMFCSGCTPAPETGPIAPGTTFVPEGVLIATSVGTSSHATVRVTKTEAQGSWAVGESIPGLGTIDRIGYASIEIVDADGRRGTLSLLEAAANQKGAATPDPGVAAASPFDDRVKKIDDSTYDVDRALVRELVSGAAGGKGGIRAVPIIKDGNLDGMRLLAVKPGSAPAAIGLKSNDILNAIDGAPIKTAQQMIDLYAKLDQLSTVELQGTRAGKPLAVRLNLH